MKQIVKYTYYTYLIIILFFIASLSGCIKDRNPGATDFSNLKPLLEIRDNISGVGNDAGLANFSRATLIFLSTEPDTTGFYVNIASVNPLTQDLNVTVDIDDAVISSYNATSDVKYEKLPEGSYSFTQKQVTIKAGERVGLFPLILFPDKIDPTKDYMLPISIKDAQGQAISGNYGTIYYHTIGNPYAGNYSVVGTRTNYTGGASGGVVAGVTDLAGYSPKLAAPETKTTVVINYANFGSDANYHISFDTTTQTITDVNIDLTGVSNLSVDLAEYVAATKTIHIKSHYSNSAGNDRVIEETFTKQ